MEIAQTLMKKKLAIGLIVLVVASGLSGVSYIMYKYFTNNKKNNNNSTASTELPDGSTINLTVNNIVQNGVHPETSTPEKESIVIPKLPNKSKGEEKPKKMDSLMSVAPIQQAPAERPQPKMLVVSTTNGDTGIDKNTITGTDTSVGVGELNSKLQNQKSPYTLFAGTFIPATMVTGLNSELNGEIIAIVRNNVFDTTMGKYLLIPQGSRLIGTYNHDVAYGQNRLVAGWNRVIYPNGTSLVLKGQPGTDLQGFSGFTGTVDNHYLQIFGSAFLIGGIMGGMSAGMGNQATNPYALSPGATMASMVGSQMAQTGLQVVSKGINIPPTIIISPGYRFNVLTTADIILKPYIYKN